MSCWFDSSGVCVLIGQEDEASNIWMLAAHVEPSLGENQDSRPVFCLTENMGASSPEATPPPEPNRWFYPLQVSNDGLSSPH